MKQTTLISCLLFFFIHYQSSACLNDYVLDSAGHRHEVIHTSLTRITVFTKDEVQTLKSLENSIKTASDKWRYKYISNYCSSLIKVGRFKTAIPLLENLLINYANEYQINANIAVAYELNGQLDEALKYLQISMKLDSNSHINSEWIHLRILEAAIEMRGKKTPLEQLDILKIGQDTAKVICYQLSYQLLERIPLSPSTNQLLCKVLEESADYYAAHISLVWAMDWYAVAIGYCNDPAIELKLRQKMTDSREKLLLLISQGNRDDIYNRVSKYDWEKQLEKTSERWRKYTPYYYKWKVVESFTN